MALSLRTAAHSEVGLVRQNNQDSGYVSPRMLVVADGMGGAAAGDLASAVAVHSLAEADADLDTRLAAAARARAQPSTEREHEDDAAAPEAQPPKASLADVQTVIADSLKEANKRLAALAVGDRTLRGMGTTVCAFVLFDDSVSYANIGDSRAYLLRDDELRRITHDHSWVQTLVDDGKITEEAALEHPHRSLIMRVLNGNPVHEPDFSSLDLALGDRLIICSDGLCGLVTDAAIAAKADVTDREMAIASLVDLAHEAGGFDNITIIVADVVEGEPNGETALYGSVRTAQFDNDDTVLLPPLVDDNVAPTALTASRRSPHGRTVLRPPVTEEERYGLRTGRRTMWVRVTLAVLLPLLAIGGGAYALFGYSQTRFFIGPHDQSVAVFQGVPDRVLGAALNHVVADDGVRLADLPPYYLEQVTKTIPVADADAGKSRLAELKVLAAKCVAQRDARARATAGPSTPSPAMTLTESPASTTPDATGPVPESPSSSPTPAPTPTTPTTPEDC